MINSTYRIQFNKNFKFNDVFNIVDYLKLLGLKCIYSSPVLKSVSGSNHGYDVTDYETINPEVGGEKDFIKLSSFLHKNNIFWIQDIVPNHMAMSSENKYIQDVFKNGQNSSYYNLFDVFKTENFGKKIILPFLGKTYEESLNDFSIIDDKIKIENSLYNISNNSYNFKENINDRYKMHDFLIMQNFNPKYWKTSISGTNYRRFFSVNSLIAVNTMDYYDLINKKIIELSEKGLIDGFRVDHIDGLFDPEEFLLKLNENNKYIYIEKILKNNEKLNKNFKCNGTTGYDFLFYCNYLFTDKNNENKLKNVYFKFINKKLNFNKMLRQRKLYYINNYYKSELNYLSQLFYDNVKNKIYGNECSFDGFMDTIKNIFLNINLYRTYLPENKNIIINILKRIKSYEAGAMIKMINENDLYCFKRLEQFMPAITAKNLEDNMFFRYNLLVSLNEVGCDPLKFNVSVNEMHRFNRYRLKNMPLSINALSTHDTKYGEDLRGKINVISEMPDEWDNYLNLWNNINRKYIKNIDQNDIYYYYQILLSEDPVKWNSKFYERVKNQMIKIIREGSVNSDWNNINSEYEGNIIYFIKNTMNDKEFIDSYEEFYKKIIIYGNINSISQEIIKITAPGIPDNYQGSEFKNNNFTDPDNRNTIDFNLLKNELNNVIKYYENNNYNEILNLLYSNNFKLLINYLLLNLRNKDSDLFNGEYIEIKSKGKYKNNVFSFARKYNKKILIIIIPIKISFLNGKLPVKVFWDNTEIISKKSLYGVYYNLLDKEYYHINGNTKLSYLINIFPFALLYGDLNE